MSLLAAVAGQAGLKLVKGVLSRRLGDANGKLAGEVLEAIATRVGVPADQLESVEDSKRGEIIAAMRDIEATVIPEQINLMLAENEARLAMFAAEQDGPAWVSAWRPAGMYVLGFLWLWNTVFLHIANAIWKIALPVMPFDQLLQLSGLYMGLYMGGHTVKDVVAKWVAR
jgi:hypothetical protein